MGENRNFGGDTSRWLRTSEGATERHTSSNTRFHSHAHSQGWRGFASHRKFSVGMHRPVEAQLTIAVFSNGADTLLCWLALLPPPSPCSTIPLAAHPVDHNTGIHSTVRKGLRTLEAWNDIVSTRYNTADRAKKQALSSQASVSIGSRLRAFSMIFIRCCLRTSSILV